MLQLGAFRFVPRGACYFDVAEEEGDRSGRRRHVFCDEKATSKALDRTQPGRPLKNHVGQKFCVNRQSHLTLRALSFRDDTGSDAFGQVLASPRALRVPVVLRVGKEAELTEHSRASVFA
jgi:hypothetical protein